MNSYFTGYLSKESGVIRDAAGAVAGAGIGGLAGGRAAEILVRLIARHRKDQMSIPESVGKPLYRIAGSKRREDETARQAESLGTVLGATLGAPMGMSLARRR